MLYYSGYTRRIGDVDDGSTVTDFLPAERARGITIQSAAVTMHWPPVTENDASLKVSDSSRPHVSHTVNLIDTPGHADFTFEVLRSLRILDGASEKLDQDFEVGLQSVRFHGGKAVRVGLWEFGDAVNLCALKWEEGGDGKLIQHFTLDQLKKDDPKFAEEVIKARAAIVEALCEFDEGLLENWLECNDDSLLISPNAITKSLPGQIGVIAGLKHARTGDTLLSYTGAHPKNGPLPPLNILQLRPIEVPPPVFFAAIEPHSLSEEKNVAEILQLLLREDPSLHVNIDAESGQMQLSGMGELHLEIAKDRLVNDFKAKATMGNIEIGYRECVLSSTSPQRYIFDR
ncbi:hypothetical protein DID88_002604 [Monilinia fructigena]|uniref:Tr-type G domain-containing protein n=1 Tax=Monilinia fructigena TaxID=38457 RepID=A0A395IR93_9HELO|nr:hypothetical protein DID88_002604 [Monilinia fructigena]